MATASSAVSPGSSDDTMGCDPVEDDLLVRYLMGDLDSSESAEVETLIRDNPAAKTRMGVLKACLEADAAAEADSIPPEDLVSRTTEIVMSSTAARVGECVGRKRFSLLDMAAVGVAALLMGALTLPALQAARDDSRRLDCAQKMRTLAEALNQYRGRYNSQYPAIGPTDNAGMFSVALRDASVISKDDLQEALLCPASDLAELVAAGRAAVVVPTYAEMQVAGPVLEDRLRRFMGGSVAYRLGYLMPPKQPGSPGDYVWSIGAQECRSPILADAPMRSQDGLTAVTYHGGCGQNVLFADGHVAFVTSCWSPRLGNHLFLNDESRVAAGQGPEDLVLAPSAVTPGVGRLVRYRYP